MAWVKVFAARFSKIAESVLPAPRRAPTMTHNNSSLYRIVEMVRGPNGRLRKVCAAYHPDLDRVQQNAAFIVQHSTSTRVYIADQAGRVVQRLI